MVAVLWSFSDCSISKVTSLTVSSGSPRCTDRLGMESQLWRRGGYSNSDFTTMIVESILEMVAVLRLV